MIPTPGTPLFFVMFVMASFVFGTCLFLCELLWKRLTEKRRD